MFRNVLEYSPGIQGWEEAGHRLEGSEARERPARPGPGAEREPIKDKAKELPPF